MVCDDGDICHYLAWLASILVFTFKIKWSLWYYAYAKLIAEHSHLLVTEKRQCHYVNHSTYVFYPYLYYLSPGYSSNIPYSFLYVCPYYTLYTYICMHILHPHTYNFLSIIHPLYILCTSYSLYKYVCPSYTLFIHGTSILIQLLTTPVVLTLIHPTHFYLSISLTTSSILMNLYSERKKNAKNFRLY